MRRYLHLVKFLLETVQESAGLEGIRLPELSEKWARHTQATDLKAADAQCIYHIKRCVEAGLLTFESSHWVQLTWAGHDYLLAHEN